MAKEHSRWKRQPASADYAAALSFLSLIYPQSYTIRLLSALRRGRIIQHAAKDLLRASGLPLLARDEPHVEADLKRLRKDKPLSPVLLIQGDMSRGISLVVADGYHRICASWYHDEDAPVSCCIASAQPAPPSKSQ